MRRDIVLVGVLLAVVVAVSTWAIVGDYMQRQAQSRRVQVLPESVLPAPSPPPPIEVSTKPVPTTLSTTPPKRAFSISTSRPQPAVTRPEVVKQSNRRAYQRPMQNQPVTREVAREALAFVGADSAAEEVWNRAINDPGMPPNIRKDLIEDLNEHGFPDPRNITPDDLPLIVNRIALIERFGPEAMDEVNYRAFQEAYKDLVNMYNRVAPQ
jgi:hypothetical protein